MRTDNHPQSPILLALACTAMAANVRMDWTVSGSPLAAHAERPGMEQPRPEESDQNGLRDALGGDGAQARCFIWRSAMERAICLAWAAQAAAPDGPSPEEARGDGK